MNSTYSNLMQNDCEETKNACNLAKPLPRQ